MPYFWIQKQRESGGCRIVLSSNWPLLDPTEVMCAQCFYKSIRGYLVETICRTSNVGDSSCCRGNQFVCACAVFHTPLMLGAYLIIF